MIFSEKWGTDVDEAVRLALIDLKLTIDEVDVTVLEEPSKGFFGIGSKLAKVRVSLKEVKKEENKVQQKKAEVREVKPVTNVAPKEKSADRSFEKKQKKDRPERKPKYENTERSESKERPERFSPAQEKPSDLVPVEEHVAITFLKEVTEKMGLNLEITAMKNDTNIYVDIQGKDSGTVIGKRGQTLDSIQYLTSLVVNKDKEKYVRVVVDAENYRTKRERTLEQLANRLADKVIRTKKSVRLEPMNPYERKVIHAALQNNPAITTRSEGEEPYRRVIIELK